MSYPNWFLFWLAILLGYLSYIDWKYLSISIFDLSLLLFFDLISMIAFFVSHSFLNGNELMIRFILLIAFLVLFLVLVLAKKMGLGDFWFFCLVGFLLKPIDMIRGLFYSFMIGGVYSIFLVLSDKKNLKKKIPLIPFLTIGILLTILLCRI